MTRPVPVILSAIALGMLALLQLLGTLSMVIAGVLILHKGLPPTPVPSPLPPSFLPIMMFALSLFYAALAVWSILTLIGLVRLRSWARYSVLVIAGFVACFGAIATLTSIAMPFLMHSIVPAAQSTPAPTPMRGIFIFMGVIYAAFTVVAIAILVYYNLAKTRALFLQYAPPSLEPPNTSTGRPRPTAIAIISWFFMISGPLMLLYSLVPIPAYLFGFAVYGLPARLIYVLYAILAFTIGYGLFRLRSEARIAFVAWMIFGILNMLAILTPWGSRNFQAYMDKFVPHLPMASTPNPFASVGFVVACFAFGMAINGFILWLLHRHREAFTPAPLPPPIPAFDASFG